MDFPFQNCLISADNFSVQQVRQLLDYRHGMAYLLLDLLKLEEEMQQLAGKDVWARYLSVLEQDHASRFRSEKRKREWFGGRLAAKCAAAAMLGQNGNALSWSDLAVIPDENGRPFLNTDKKIAALPDVSISHSGNLAAALAVSNGYCGIDIQKVTDRIIKLRERFCKPDEERILLSFFNGSIEKQSILLTMIWAAKEAIRKVANTRSLPGFLDLELAEISGSLSHESSSPWRFMFICKRHGMNNNPETGTCSVAVSLITEYALALTTRNDTVG